MPMEKKKRIAALLLALAACCGLSGCGAAPAPTAEEEAPKSEWRLQYDREKVPAEITRQPRSKPGAVGTQVFLSVEAEGEKLVYQWQYRSGPDGEWKDCSRPGFDTPDYTVTLKSYHGGYQLRCRISNRGGEVYTEPVTLELLEEPFIAGEPESLTAKTGDSVSFSVLAGGGGLRYRWYYRKSVKGLWTPCSGEGHSSACYSLRVKDYHDGYQYRCEVSNDLGRVYTQVVTLTVK